MWRNLWARSTYERDLAEEMEFHLVSRTEDLVKRGHSATEAEQVARLEFGPTETAKEYCRDQDRLWWLEELWRNLRFARRRFIRRPVLSATIIVTLGLCLSANAILFGVVDDVLLSGLPYPNSAELYQLQTSRGEDIAQRSDSVDGATWFALEQALGEVEIAVVTGWTQGVNFVATDPSGATQASLVKQQRVGHQYFDVLGVPLTEGRDFLPAEDLVGASPVVVVSWRLWQEELGGRGDALGEALNLAGESHTIIGVTAPEFDGGVDADLWVPLRPTVDGEGEGTNFQVVARVGDSDRARIQTELSSIGRELAEERGLDRFEFVMTALSEAGQAGIRSNVILLWSAVAMVLLIGSVNIAGLLLATTGERATEISTRRAMGGGLASVVRQLVTESLFLSGCGVALGLAIAWVGFQWMRTSSGLDLGVSPDLGLNWRVSLATCVIAALATVVFGLAPSFAIARGAAIHMRTRGAISVYSGARKTLVVAQVALGVVLLLMSGLLLRSLMHLTGGDPGVDVERVMSATVSLKDARFESADRIVQFFESGQRQLEDSPHIGAAGVVLSLPFERGLNLGFRYGGEAEHPITVASYVSPKALELLGVRLSAGRHFDQRDRKGGAPVVLVSEAFTAQYFPREERTDTGADLARALGQQITLSGEVREIVGVVGDVRQVPSFGKDRGDPLVGQVPTAYIPVGQAGDEFFRVVHTWFRPSFVVRTTGELGKASLAVTDALRAADPLTPVASLRNLKEVRRETLAGQRSMAGLFSGLALLALVLASVGVAGATASAVTERKKELGVRLALGAKLSQAIAKVAAPGILLVAVGVAIGVVLARAGARGVEHLLYGVDSTDIFAHLLAVAIIFLVAGAASVIPALRVSKMSVVETLAEE